MIRKARKGLNSYINIKHVKFTIKTLTLSPHFQKLNALSLLNL